MSSIEGHFDESAIALDEPAALTMGYAVRIVFDSTPEVDTPQSPRPSLAGFAKGLFTMSDEFNEPLEGLPKLPAS